MLWKKKKYIKYTEKEHRKMLENAKETLHNMEINHKQIEVLVKQRDLGGQYYYLMGRASAFVEIVQSAQAICSQLKPDDPRYAEYMKIQEVFLKKIDCLVDGTNKLHEQLNKLVKSICD